MNCESYATQHRLKSVPLLVELRGVEPLRPACKAGIIPLDHSPAEIGRGGGIRTRSLSFMRRTLFPDLSYSARKWRAPPESDLREAVLKRRGLGSLGSKAPSAFPSFYSIYHEGHTTRLFRIHFPTE